MSDLILLRDRNRCPHCRARRSFSSGHCHNCGMRLFIRPINFRQFEDDGNDRRYWLWTIDRGWIHRDFVMLPDEKPLSRNWNITTPEPNTKTAKERMAEIKCDTKAKIRERISTIQKHRATVRKG
jgi:hypothetical protein